MKSEASLYSKDIRTSLLQRQHALQVLPKKARKLHHSWRLYDLASAIAGSLALIFAVVDYEHRWDDDRTHRTCRQLETHTAWRVAITVLSIAAMSFATMRHLKKSLWLELVKKTRHVKPTNKRNLLKLQFLLEICILAIFPYPYFDATFHIYEPINASFDLINVCYYWSEILFILMFLRAIPLIRALLNFTKYLDDNAFTFCRNNDVKSNARFTFRCLVKDSPLYSITLALIPTILIFSVIVRVFERPMEEVSGFDHRYYTNTLWLVCQTLFNSAYGDIYPISTGGRAVSIISAVLGVCAFSYFVFVIERTLSLTTKENKAYSKINKSRPAAKVILRSLEYHIIKKKYGAQDSEAIKKLNALLAALTNYRSVVENLKRKASIQEEVGGDQNSNHHIFTLLRKIDRKVTNMETQITYLMTNSNPTPRS
mmetsp:Transcript_12344/g.23414  ORF Transcript_12344/g.23414 Transcript_12344/m.23414 type:complete len:427 (+) Transcript_12344:485-1765(+)